MRKILAAMPLAPEQWSPVATNPYFTFQVSPPQASENKNINIENVYNQVTHKKRKKVTSDDVMIYQFTIYY